jgi:hypothetical protein
MLEALGLISSIPKMEENKNSHNKRWEEEQAQSVTPMLPATQEAEIGRIMV